MRQKALGNCLWCGKPAGGFARCEKHREWFRKYARKLRCKDIEKSRKTDREKAKRLLEINGDKIRATRRAYYVKNRDRMRRIANETRAKNLAKFRQRDKSRRPKVYQRKKLRWHSDPIYKMSMKLRTSLLRGLRSQSVRKTNKAVQLLGCSIPNFIIYIESKFEPGMSWGNWGNRDGDWHLDHIMPIAIFDLSRESHQQRCFHFSNYQPLWKLDNLRKNATPPSTHQFEIL